MFFLMNRPVKRGFTLIEILLVVAAIAILAGIVILAINPGKQLGQTRDAQRRADVNTILNAVYQWSLDNNGTMPAVVTADETPICPTKCTTIETCVDLNTVLVTGSPSTGSGNYLVAIPDDPNLASPSTGGACTNFANPNGKHYVISQNTATKRITVRAPAAEEAKEPIQVTR